MFSLSAQSPPMLLRPSRAAWDKASWETGWPRKEERRDDGAEAEAVERAKPRRWSEEGGEGGVGEEMDRKSDEGEERRGGELGAALALGTCSQHPKWRAHC